MPTRWLGNSLAPGESELQSRPRGKETFPQTLPGTLRTESTPHPTPTITPTPPPTPVLYIASSDGLVEIQFHIFNYQFSWGGEVFTSPLPRWVLDPHCGLGSALHYLPLWPGGPSPSWKGAGSGARCSPPPHAPPCPFAQLPRYPQQWGGGHTGRGGGTSPCIYLKSDVIY